MTPDQALAKARKLAKSGSVAEAVVLYRQLVDLYPNQKKIRKELKALQKSAPADIQQAAMAQEFQSLVATYSSGQMDRALAQARHLTKIYPTQPLPLNIIGVIQNQRGSYKAAVEYCSKALDLEPSYGDALNNLGSALHKLGQHEEAQDCYQRLLSIHGEDPDVLFNLANVFKDKAELESAISCYQRSLQIRPLYLPAQLQLGQSQLAMDEHADAMNCFNKAIELDHQSIEAHCGIGDVLLARNQPYEAVAWYRDALKFDDKEQVAQNGMARALMAAGNFEEAVPLMKTYLELNPDDTEIVHLLDAAQNNTTDIAPRQYIEKTFNGYAKKFEEHLTKQLGYQAPAQLRELVATCAEPAKNSLRAADLGCGTGLVGDAFQDICSSLIGIDLSAKMLEETEKKSIYTELLLGDIVETLNRLDDNFDLFISADTFIYLGNLRPLADVVAQRTVNGALFAFSTELEQGSGYTLKNSGRYAHSNAYIEEVLEGANFEILRQETLPLRKEKGEWLQGGFYLARYIGGKQSL
ncbi:MAG: tetratricopeptide repeat protein [Halioglobus sp.]